MNEMKGTESKNLNEKSSEKRQIIHDIFILDSSGSMTSIEEPAVDSFNETLAFIKSSQLKNIEKQVHYITLVTFCGCSYKVLYNDEYCGDVANLKYSDYTPCCMTPLYDAIGKTLNKYKSQVKNEEDSIGVVTIITDGYENASQEYSGKDVKHIINSLKEEGWSFTYVGTDHDVTSVSVDLHIDNTIKFEKSCDGMKSMNDDELCCRQAFYDDICEMHEMPEEERRSHYRERSKGYVRKK